MNALGWFYSTHTHPLVPCIAYDRRDGSDLGKQKPGGSIYSTNWIKAHQLLNCFARFCPWSFPTTLSSSKSHLFPTRTIGTWGWIYNHFSHNHSRCIPILLNDVHTFLLIVVMRILRLIKGIYVQYLVNTGTSIYYYLGVCFKASIKTHTCKIFLHGP